MKNKLNILIAPAIVLCWCLFSLQACKDPVLENTNLLTKSDNLNLAKYSVKLKILSQSEIPLASNGVTVGLLGSMYDHNFGTTYAGFYAQCPLTTNGVFFGIHPTLDSAVLTLAYNGQYGLCSKPVSLVVYELNQSLLSSSAYYTNSSFQVKTPAAGQLNGFVPDMVDSVNVQGVNEPAHIRVRLSNSLGNKLLLADSATLQNDSAFLSYFKGIYVTTNSAATGNGLVYINLPSALSGINLYYHYLLTDTSTSAIAGNFFFPFSGVTVNHFDNTYYGTPVYSAIHAPNPNGDQKMYVQGGAGVKGKIMITLDSLLKKVAINKAELVLSQSATDTQYAAPLSLSLLRIDDAGTGQLLEDVVKNGYGAVLETDVINGVSINRYRFNITLYFQKLIQGIHNNNGLYVQVSSAYTNSERIVIANSSTDKKYQLSLIVTYTKL